MVEIFVSTAVLLVAFLNLLLGVVVFGRNPKNIVNKTFTLLALSFFAWGLALFFYQYPIIFSSLFWIKLDYVLVMCFASAILIFSFVFPQTVFKKAWVYAGLFIVLYFITNIWVLFFTKLWVVDVSIDLQTGLQTILGPYYIWFTGWTWLVLLWGVINLILKSKLATATQRLQIKYFWIGFILFGIAVCIPDVIVPIVWQTTEYFPVSVIASIFFSGISAYLILKHRFLDIRFVVARTVAYSLLLISITTCYASAAFFLSSAFFGPMVNTNHMIVYTILTVIVALSFDSVRRFFEKATDKIFFKGIYNSDELLTRIGIIMSTNLELRSLISQITNALIDQMRISKGVLVVLGEKPGVIYEMVDFGFTQSFDLTYEQMSLFFSSSQMIIFDELKEDSLKSLLREKQISVVKILKVKTDIVGLLLLGEKSSGEIYSSGDLKVLEILAPEMAVSIQNSLSYDKIKRFNVVLSQEITNATTDLKVANQRLQTIDKLKDDFVSIASHELRTPMTAIRSYAWMALHRADVPLSKTLEKYLARILISTERLINLVNDMLNVSRIESNRIEVIPEPIDIYSLVKDIIDEVYYSKSEEKKVEFMVTQRQVPKVFADPGKLRQVFLNLVGNSLKFTPDGGKITFDFFSDGINVETYVSDTGVGISKEDISKLFHKFSRLDNSYIAAATSGGTGLGLYISKNLVDLMKGKIRAYSEGLGRGTTVAVSMPVATESKIKEAEKYAVRPVGESKGLESVAM